MKTVVIALEGLDGCGKTTQHRLLEERLRQAGVFCQSFSMLAPGPIRQAVLRDPALSSVQRLALLKVAAESTRLSIELAKELAVLDTVVLLDRAYDSFVAYQGWGDNLHEEIALVDRLFEPFITPDLAFILDIPVEVSQQRLQHGRETLDVIESRPSVFFERVRAGFLHRLAQPNRVLVNAHQSPEEVHATIWRHTASLLSLKESPNHEPDVQPSA